MRPADFSRPQKTKNRPCKGGTLHRSSGASSMKGENGPHPRATQLSLSLSLPVPPRKPFRKICTMGPGWPHSQLTSLQSASSARQATRSQKSMASGCPVVDGSTQLAWGKMAPTSERYSAVSDTPSIPLDFLSLTPLQGMSLVRWGNREFGGSG